MVLSHEVRARKIREVAERHGWTIAQTEAQLKSYLQRVVTSEAALLDALAQMQPDEVKRTVTV